MVDYKHIYSEVFKNAPKYNGGGKYLHRYAAVYDAIERYEITNAVDIGTGRGIMVGHIIKAFGIPITTFDLRKFHPYDTPHINGDITKKKDRKKIPQCMGLFCLDLLEHLEEHEIDPVLYDLGRKADYYVFATSQHSDEVCGHELHLTIRGYDYWHDMIDKYFNIVDINHLKRKRPSFIYVCTRKNYR